MGAIENQVFKLGLFSIFAVIFSTCVFSEAEAGAPLSPTADMIFVVDESGSMGGEHDFLAGGIAADIDNALMAEGIGDVTPNGFGLVGFGTSSHGAPPVQGPHKHLVGGGDFGNAQQFATAAGGLIASGGFEDGYEAMNFALGYNFRGGCPDSTVARQIILVTDEDRDIQGGVNINFNSMRTLLEDNCIIPNVIVDAQLRDGEGNVALGVSADGTAYIADGSGGFTTALGGNAIGGDGDTIDDYVNLAHALGGAAWDLNQLRAGGNTAESFANAIIDIKVEEIGEVILPGEFQVLGHDNINHNHVEININTGAATILGASTFSSGASGMESARVPADTAEGEFPPGTPFGLYRDEDDGKDYVVTVNRQTGASTKVVEVIDGITGRGVGFGPVNEDGTQEFFATDLVNGLLYTIDLFTGQKTLVGPIILDGDNQVGTDNLQWDADSQMFVSLLKDTGPVNVAVEHPETIIMIDPETAEATSQSTLSERLGACTVARNPFTGIWYSINTITSEFVQIDIDTGMVNPVGPLDPEETGDVSNLICGMAFEEPLEVIGDSTGGDDHEPPTIGKSLDGVRQVVANGIGIDGQTWTVTKDYHQEFELIEMLTSPHTITNEIFCNEGYQECNHIIVAFMGLDEFFPTTTMKVEAHKTGQDWEISWSDPNDFIKDPDDENDPQDITFTSQVIDEKRIGTSFTIDFRNKDTGQLKLGIQVRDMEGGVRNFYFNEGVMFHDADGYPDAEALYDAPLEVDRLCLNEDPDYRNSCAFAEKRQQATQMAEDTLKQMTENQYRYN